MIAIGKPQEQRLRLHRRTLDCILPPPRVRTYDWICDNVRTKDGLPFNHIDYPWVEGICDEWDSPRRNTIWLQFAARLGKSLTAQALLVASIGVAPAPAMIATSTEKLLVDTIRDKLWPMFDRCPKTRSWVPPKHEQNRLRMDLRHSVIYGGWSGSVSSLADKDPRYKWAFEIDKMSADKSEEADPLQLFNERGIEIPDRKSIYESTPAIAGRSRVNRGLLKGTNCRFQVPCRKCQAFQQLIRGDGKPGTGGLIWDKDDDGHSTPSLAYNTARYRCAHCQKELDDADRRPMIRAGKWVPAGCRLDKRGRMHGTPLNDGPDASFQLGRLYAPTFTFGDVAKNWVESLPSEEDRRNHINSWDGEVWELLQQDYDWEDVASRLCTAETVVGIAPADTVFLTMGVDVQVDHLVYAVTAWAAGSVATVIAYGIAQTWDELNDIRKMPRSTTDSRVLVPMMTLIDARDGNKTEEVKEVCKAWWKPSGPWVYPSMGQDSGQMAGRTFTKTVLDEHLKSTRRNKTRSKRKGLDEFYLIMINTNYWEQWMHQCLYFRTAGDPRSLCFPASSRTDEDLFTELCNVVPDYGLGDSDAVKRYVRADTTIPKDLRDAIRYSRVAAEVYTHGNWERVIPPRPPSQPASGPRAKPPPSVPEKEWVRTPDRNRFIRRRDAQS